MIGILIIAHGNLGDSLIHCASHVMGAKPPLLQDLVVGSDIDPIELLPNAQMMVASLNQGDGVLILSDIYGASPCNLVTKLLNPGIVEGIAGVNLPMLVRTLTYRDRPLKKLIEKAISGGRDGVVHFSEKGCSWNKSEMS